MLDVVKKVAKEKNLIKTKTEAYFEKLANKAKCLKTSVKNICNLKETLISGDFC